jgi:hypothetical protein
MLGELMGFSLTSVGLISLENMNHTHDQDHIQIYMQMT